MLEQAIKKEFQHQFKDWIYGAKHIEKKGLYLISKIIKYNGKGVFSDYKHLKPQADINDLTYKVAFERAKNRNTSTSRRDFVHTTSVLYKNIFQERDINETPYA